MLFFLLLVILTLAAALVSRLGAPGLADWPARMRLAMALALFFIGSDHLVTPERYLPMMPGFVPYPFGVVIFTGLCEIAGGLGLLTRRFRKPAAIALAVYFLAVFPANIKNAIEGSAIEGLPTVQWYYWDTDSRPPSAYHYGRLLAGKTKKGGLDEILHPTTCSLLRHRPPRSQPLSLHLGPEGRDPRAQEAAL